MTKYDVGKLNRHDRVIADGRIGTVTSVHEPEWIDHKTRGFRKELQGADIEFDHELGGRSIPTLTASQFFRLTSKWTRCRLNASANLKLLRRTGGATRHRVPCLVLRLFIFGLGPFEDRPSRRETQAAL
jgi:hypothetical protein